MPSDYDATEFVDGDFQPPRSSQASAPLARAPTREEVDSKVAAAHHRLAELKREKEEIERQRVALEETRRRQIEFQTGRSEMIQNLTRGLGLLEEAEFSARREAEQMAKAMDALRDALAKIEVLQEENWSKDNFSVELTRALTTLENARMEWNAARLKFSLLSDSPPNETPSARTDSTQPFTLAAQPFGQLCRLGLALTWPVAAVVIIFAVVVLLLLFRR
jgi:hypothetical protein